MDFLLVVGLIILIYALMPKANTSKSIGDSAKLVIKEKVCPPHKWFWQEMIDQNGVKQGERMVCKICGPLSKLLNRDEQ